MKSLEHIIREIAEASAMRNSELRKKVVNVARPDDAKPTDDSSKLAKQGEIKAKVIDEENLDEADLAKKAAERHFGNPDDLHAHLKRSHAAGDQDSVASVIGGAPTHSLQKLHAKLKPQDGERQQHRDKELFHISIGGELKRRGIKEEVVVEAAAAGNGDEEMKTDATKKEKTKDKDKVDAKKITGGKTEVDLEPSTDDRNDDGKKEDDKGKKATKEANKTAGIKEQTMSNNLFGLPQPLIDAVNEALKGGQKKLDKNHNGKLDADDFKKLRKEEAVVEDEQIDEVSKKTLSNYIRKASSDAANHAYTAGTGGAGKMRINRDEFHAKASSRLQGISKAAQKLAKEEVEEIDELSSATYKSAMNKAGNKAMWLRSAGTNNPEYKKRYNQAKKFQAKGIEQEKKEKAMKEAVEFSAEELARLEEIAKKFD